MLDIAIVSDEIHASFKNAVEYGVKWGVKKYEIRVLSTGRIPYVEASDIKEVKDTMNESGVEVTAVSPGIFKIPLNNKAGYKKEHEETIFKTFDIAKEFNTNKVIIFGIERYENEPEENYNLVIENLSRMAETAEKNGFQIFVENEPGFWCDTGENTAKILKQINSPALRSNWDLGNSFTGGQTPYPDGYEYVKGLVGNLHIKDYIVKKDGSFECVTIDKGNIDWEGQFRAIMNDSDLGHVTVETHCLPLVEKSKKNVEEVAAILKKITEGK